MSKGLLADYLWRYRGRWLTGALVAVLSTGFSLAAPWVLREAIDTFSGTPTLLAWPLEYYALAIVALALLEGICRYFARIVTNGASRWAEYELRNRYFGHLERMDPAFFQRHRTGDLIARATNDLSAIRQLFGPALYQVLNVGLQVVVTMYLLFRVSASLALWCALIVPVAIGLYALTRTRTEQRFTKVQEQFAAMSDHVQETLAGERVVKAYAQESAEIEKFRRTSEEYVARQISQIRISGVLWPSMSLTLGILTVLLLYLGGREVIEGRLSVGAFVQFNTYVGLLSWPAMALGWVATMWQQGLASARRLDEVLAEQPAIVDLADRLPITRARGEIEFRDVSLELGGRMLLSHISLHIPAGSTYAIVGPLGSGKSLLVSLIARLADVTSGQVLVDGRDVRAWPLADLRRQIGFVPQETLLFSGALRENIAFGVGEDGDTESRVGAAVDLSRLENDFDQWPSGLLTQIGERGITLSGGQKQRTAIARAVAREPAILILDDALSSVDTRTEEAVLDGLRGFMADRTSLIIAHRLSTTRLADSTVVLAEGRIVEEGTHAELLRRGPIYTHMYRRQLLAQELEVDEDAIENGSGDSELAGRG